MKRIVFYSVLTIHSEKLNTTLVIQSACKKIGKSAFVESLLFYPQEDSRSLWFIVIDPKRIKHITLIAKSSDSLTGKDASTRVCNGLWNYAKREFKNHSFYLRPQIFYIMNPITKLPSK